MTQIASTEETGLANTSAADAFQIRGVSLERFSERLGKVSSGTLDQIVAAVAVAIEFA